jgi:superfamily II DNA or RNA helicase
MTTRLRVWQQTALSAYFEKDTAQDYTVNACPGAGKTTFALRLAKQLLQQGRINRVIVVAPTDHLRHQWATAADSAGITLDAKLGNDSRVPEGCHGYVTTYAQVASRPLIHERRTTGRNRALVIFDEIHHLGDGLSWGDAAQQAFADAVRRLNLTGTPFRTSSSEQIPFLTYEEDDQGLVSVADYTYGYREALADGVVRPVVFSAWSGSASWVNQAGSLLEGDLSQPASKREEEATWKALLAPESPWVRSVIAAAHSRLQELRANGSPDAGCLLLANDHDSARAYADLVRQITGHTPTVVLSDDAAASKKIDAFNRGTDPFLVAVRMVSEGVDIQRLQVLVWLTSYRTPMFFAQAVGRVVRARKPGETATVFLPAVRALLALAAAMEEERDHHITITSALDDEPIVRADPSDHGTAHDRTVDATARFDSVLVNGRSVQPTRGPERTDEEQAFLGLPGLLTDEEEALLLAQREVTQPSAAPPPPALTPAPTREGTRADVNALVRQFAAKRSLTIPQAHAALRAAVPGPAMNEASVDLLLERRDWLLSATQ